MKPPSEYLLPNRKTFAGDPFGYSASAWHKFGVAATIAGFDVNISKPPTADDLKNPVLWLSQAHALSEAARVLFENDPKLETMPLPVRGMCDSQYCAVGLMLVGYSLETCLKAMIIIKKGVEAFSEEEKKFKHHRLVELASFIPNLSDKDKAILRALTHFTYWAGRYPDPGSGREQDAEDVFTISETHQIAGRDLFGLATRVMRYTTEVLRQVGIMG